MKKDKTRIIEIASVYTGTVIGAGFASGQEMIQFFASYGIKGVYGIILAGLLQAVLGFIILDIMYVYRYSNYKEFLYPMTGKRVGALLNIAVSFFMFVCFCAMLSGCGAVLRQQFNVSVQLGIIIMALACAFTFIYGVEGIIAANTLLAPLLLVGQILLGIYLIMVQDVGVFSALGTWRKVSNNWVFSSLIYVSYNTLTACVVLCTLSSLLKNRKVARLGGLLGGIALGIIGLCIGIPILIHYEKIKGLEVPIMGLLLDYSLWIQYLYFFVLIIAMFTTAVANGYGFLERISDYTKIPWNRLIIIFTLLSIIVSQIKFSHIVAKIYPLFGYVGLFEILLIFVYYISMRLKH